MSLAASGIPSNTLSEVVAVIANPYDLRSAWDIVCSIGAMADADDADDGNDNNDQGDEGGEDSSDSSGDDKKEDGKPEANVKDPDKKRLSDEAAAHRNKAKAEKARADAAEKRLRELEDKDKGELEKAQRDLKELSPKVEQLESTVKKQAVELAFFKSGAAAQFRDTDVALSLLREDLKEIEIDEDGNVDTDALKAAAKALLDRKTYLKADESDSSDGDGLPSGRRTNGKKLKGDANNEALFKKFPALRK